MMAGGQAPQYGKKNLGPDSTMRWGAIANRLTGAGNTPGQAAGMANNMTREAIGRRLGIVKDHSYVQPVRR